MQQDEHGIDAFRRRAQSEVVRQSGPTSAKWKIVAAFSNLRKSWEKTSADDVVEETVLLPHDVDPPSAQSFINEGDGDHTHVEDEAMVNDGAQPTRRRKRVSLFLRRRGRFREGNMPQSAYVALPPAEPPDADADAVHFRRAQSHFVKPVSYEHGAAPASSGGEGGRYLRYAAGFDPEDFEKKRAALRKLRPAAIRLAPAPTSDQPATPAPASAARPPPKPSVKALTERFESPQPPPAPPGAPDSDGEIFGEICLEDFADDGSEDFDFLDGQIVDVWPEAVRLDGQPIALAGEEQFAAFCKEVGLHQLLKPPEPSPSERRTFDVGDHTRRQWRDDARAHNRLLSHWSPNHSAPDLRALVSRVPR